MDNISTSIIGSANDRRRTCSIPTKCDRSGSESFDEIMGREWEELVIRFDKNKNAYVFKTACCPGAPAC